ncbi:MAG TPA: SDR family NAD(P)-dependent oxidoreductase [Nocardioides sp.]|nr:SDR family NAD(P)-dependent oxidoreductase [Nocardioides sp.]
MASKESDSRVAVITGASEGLGHALAGELDRRGWTLVLDARHAGRLQESARELTGAHLIAGDVTDPAHRSALAERAAELGGASLLVNNASTLGASPQPTVAELSPEVLERVLLTNLQAPVELMRSLLPQLRATGGTVLNITSDASVEAYPGWGAYGASKAALDHVSRVLAAEDPALRVYAVDPGDMRTRMHQEAFPGEDISDRPPPEDVVPHLLALLDSGLPSGRHRAADIPVPAGVVR